MSTFCYPVSLVQICYGHTFEGMYLAACVSHKSINSSGARQGMPLYVVEKLSLMTVLAH